MKEKFYQMLIESEDYIKIESIAITFGVSTRTIYNYLNEFENNLQNRNLTIVRKSGKGIILKGSKREKEKLEKDLLETAEISTENRRQKIFDDMLMKSKTVSINKLSEYFYVSRSSIVNDLNFVEKELLKYNLSLLKTVNGTKIGDEEGKIREAQKQYILKELDKGLEKERDMIAFVTQIMKQYIKEDYLKMAQKMICFCEDELKFKLNFVYYVQIYVSMSIYFHRLGNGYKINTERKKPLAIELDEFRTYPVVQQIAIYTEKKMNIEVEQSEIDYLNNIIRAVYKDENDIKAATNSEKIEILVRHMIDSLKDVFQTDFSKDHLLINGLVKHIEGMLNRIQCHIKISNPYISQIKKQYAALYSIVSLASTVIEQYFDITLSDDEISFILIYFQAAAERANMSKKIIIVVDKIDPYTTLLESRIRKSIVMFDVIEVVEKNKIEEKYIDEFDFAISTMSLEHIQIPNVQVTLTLSDQELEYINKMYFKSFKTHLNSNVSSMIACLNEENIFLHKKYETVQECIEEACNRLVDQGCIDEQFYDSVMKREHMAPTNIVEGVALPHGLDRHVLKNRITIITLDTPLMWGEKKVEVVILLAINFSNKATTKKLLSELYFCISDNQIVRKLKECNQYRDVISVLFPASFFEENGVSIHSKEVEEK